MLRRSGLIAPGPIVLTGANGAGKTNLIEAISLLAPGRGLRRATMEELAFSEGDGAWAVSAEIEGMLGLATLGTGIDPPAGEESDADAQMPHRPRKRRFGHRLRRPFARCVADACHGPAFQRAGLRAPALSRPAGAGGRRAAFEPRGGARAQPAFAQPPARRLIRRFPLARRGRARNGRGCGRRRCRPRRNGQAPVGCS